MKTTYSILIILMVIMSKSGYAESDIDIGTAAPNFNLPDSKGSMVSLSDFKGKYVVLEWINFDCPFVKKHYDSKNMQQLQQLYAEKGVIWLSINSSAKGKQGHFTGNTLQKRIKEHAVAHTAYIQDTDGKIGKMYGARTTPHIFIINPEGYLIYHGAIDDMPSTDVNDVKGAKNYVVQVLDNALASKEVAVKKTKPYGCSVKY